MIRFLATLALAVIGNAVGLIVASMIVDGFTVSSSGFVISIVFFTVAYAILSPFVLKMALRYLPALSGGIALVTTFVVLLLTTIFTDAVTIRGVTAWIVAPLIIWVMTIVASVVLPLFLFKKTLSNVKETHVQTPDESLARKL